MFFRRSPDGDLEVSRQVADLGILESWTGLNSVSNSSRSVGSVRLRTIPFHIYTRSPFASSQRISRISDSQSVSSISGMSLNLCETLAGRLNAANAGWLSQGGGSGLRSLTLCAPIGDDRCVAASGRFWCRSIANRAERLQNIVRVRSKFRGAVDPDDVLCWRSSTPRISPF